MSLSNEVKVGVFVSAAVAVLLLFTFYIGGVTFFKPGYKVSVIFDSAQDLKSRSKVKYGGGVNIGRVSKISLTADNKLDVELLIDKKVQFKNDCYIAVSSTGMMGEKYINVSGGSETAPFVTPGEVLRGRSSGGIDAALESMSQASAELKDMLNALNKIVGGVQTSLLGSVQNVNELTKVTRDIVEKNKPSIDRSVVNFEKSSAELAAATTNLKELTGQLNNIIKDVNKADLPKTVENLNKISVKIDETITALDSAAKKIDKGEGPIATLINDKKMAEDLKAVVADLKANPWKLLWKK